MNNGPWAQLNLGPYLGLQHNPNTRIIEHDTLVCVFIIIYELYFECLAMWLLKK